MKRMQQQWRRGTDLLLHSMQNLPFLPHHEQHTTMWLFVGGMSRIWDDRPYNTNRIGRVYESSKEPGLKHLQHAVHTKLDKRGGDNEQGDNSEAGERSLLDPVVTKARTAPQQNAIDCLSQNVHIIFYLARCEESCKGTKIGEKFHSTNKADTSDYILMNINTTLDCQT